MHTYIYIYICIHIYIYIYIYILDFIYHIYNYIIALSQILTTLQIISHLVRHKPQSEFVTTNTDTIYIYRERRV